MSKYIIDIAHKVDSEDNLIIIENHKGKIIWASDKNESMGRWLRFKLFLFGCSTKQPVDETGKGNSVIEELDLYQPDKLIGLFKDFNDRLPDIEMIQAVSTKKWKHFEQDMEHWKSINDFPPGYPQNYMRVFDPDLKTYTINKLNEEGKLEVLINEELDLPYLPVHPNYVVGVDPYKSVLDGFSKNIDFKETKKESYDGTKLVIDHLDEPTKLSMSTMDIINELTIANLKIRRQGMHESLMGEIISNKFKSDKPNEISLKQISEDYQKNEGIIPFERGDKVWLNYRQSRIAATVIVVLKKWYTVKTCFGREVTTISELISPRIKNTEDICTTFQPKMQVLVEMHGTGKILWLDQMAEIANVYLYSIQKEHLFEFKHLTPCK